MLYTKVITKSKFNSQHRFAIVRIERNKELRDLNLKQINKRIFGLYFFIFIFCCCLSSTRLTFFCSLLLLYWEDDKIKSFFSLLCAYIDTNSLHSFLILFDINEKKKMEFRFHCEMQSYFYILFSTHTSALSSCKQWFTSSLCTSVNCIVSMNRCNDDINW